MSCKPWSGPRAERARGGQKCVRPRTSNERCASLQGHGQSSLGVYYSRHTFLLSVTNKINGTKCYEGIFIVTNCDWRWSGYEERGSRYEGTIEDLFIFHTHISLIFPCNFIYKAFLHASLSFFIWYRTKVCTKRTIRFIPYIELI